MPAGGRVRPRGWLLLCLAAAVATAAATLVVVGRDERPTVDEGDYLPRGRWKPNLVQPVAAEDEQARAQLLSLPYASGTVAAGASRGGIRTVDADALAPGDNFYVSGHGPEATLISSSGELIHRWRMPWRRAFPDRTLAIPADDWRRAVLLPNGDLIALFQGSGLVRIDSASRLIWASFGPYFNDLALRPDGKLWVLGKTARSGDLVGRSSEVLEDSLVLLDSEGVEERRWSLLRALIEQRPDLLDPLPAHADLLHSNTVTPITSTPPDSPIRAGDLVISFREINSIIAFDPATSTIRWGQRGPWVGQHEPTMEPDGSLLLFDNKGRAGGQSRVLRVDPRDGQIREEIDGIHSAEAGSVSRLANGNLLVTESERGRAYEFDRNHDLVWEFSTPHRVGTSPELIATLYEVQRVERPSLIRRRDQPAPGVSAGAAAPGTSAQ